MLQKLLGKLWRHTPARLRRLTMRMTHARFTVTAGAVIQNNKGEVLLLKHTFRAGSGWGLPGGFLAGGEQPLEGLRRELREEIGLEIERVEFLAARSFRKPQQVEILFHGFASGEAQLKKYGSRSCGLVLAQRLTRRLTEGPTRDRRTGFVR